MEQLLLTLIGGMFFVMWGAVALGFTIVAMLFLIDSYLSGMERRWGTAVFTFVAGVLCFYLSFQAVLEWRLSL